MKARLSVTTIDWWCTWDESTLDQLVTKLTHREPETEAKLRGTAFHEALAMLSTLGRGVDYVSTDSIQARGFTFDFNSVDVQLESVPPYQTELKIERRVDDQVDCGPGDEITVVGKTDRLAGHVVDDHKTTKRFDAERLLDSLQWRFYLWLTGCDVFRWHVYEMRPSVSPRAAFAAWLGRFEDWRDNPPATELVDDLRRYSVVGYHQLEAYRYDGLEADCVRHINQLLGVIRLACESGMLDPKRVGMPRKASDSVLV